MRVKLLVVIVAMLAVLGLERLVQAQTRAGSSTGGISTLSPMGMGSSSAGSTGSTGMFGSRPLGGSLSLGARGFGSTSMPGTLNNQGLGGFGQMGMGSSLMNTTGRPGFIGSDSRSTLGLVGSAQGTRGVGQSGQYPSRSMQQIMPQQRLPTQPGQQYGYGMQGGRNQQQPFRATLRPGFELRATTSTEAGAKLAQRLQQSHVVKTLAPVEVLVQGQTAILRGEVATEHDRLLVEQLARLEPGIWGIQNELVVAPSAAAPAENPAAKAGSSDSAPKPDLENPFRSD